MPPMLPLAMLVLVAAGARADRLAADTPVVELTTAMGWNMSETGAEIVFALYPDGRVFYVHDGTDRGAFTATLPRAKVADLLAGLAVDRVGEIHVASRMGKDGWTDCIVVATPWHRGRECRFAGFEISSYDPIPPELRAIWKRLRHYRANSEQRSAGPVPPR